jgi:cobalt-zinc-cadmium efflux system outer membrane protein
LCAPALLRAAADRGEGRSASPSSGVAEILSKDPIEVADLLRLADLASPEIAAARATAEEARGRADQAGAFPNPRLSWDAENVPEGGALGDGERTLGVALPVAPVQRRGRVSTARAEHSARVQQAAAVRLDVQRRVREQAAALVRIRDAVASRAELREAARRVEEIGRLRAEARAEPKSNALKAEIERVGAESEAAALESELTATVAQLRASLGGVDVPVARIRAAAADSSTWALETLRADAAARHPRVLAARAARDAAEAAAGAAGRAWIPEPELRVAWGRDPDDDRFVEAGASIPLPLFDRGRAEASAARAAARRAEQDVVDVEARVDAEAVAGFARWRAALARFTAHHERALPAAREAMSLAVEGYSAGRLPFLDLLDALRTLAEAQRTDLELAGERDVAEAALFALTPSSPRSTESEGDER